MVKASSNGTLMSDRPSLLAPIIATGHSPIGTWSYGPLVHSRIVVVHDVPMSKAAMQCMMICLRKRPWLSHVTIFLGLGDVRSPVPRVEAQSPPATSPTWKLVVRASCHKQDSILKYRT
jgi:hypothetical protein